MSKNFTVHHGKTYKAELKLNFFEGFVDNDKIVQKFEELGFTNVSVSGMGEKRFAHGTWMGPDESVPLTDEHLVTVTEEHAAYPQNPRPGHIHPVLPSTEDEN